MTSNQLRAVNIGLSIDGQPVLNNVSFTVSAGELILIDGPSGSGKTTLAYVLGGAVKPDRGEVIVNGTSLQDIENQTDRPALVPQDFGLISTLTAFENVVLPLQLRQYPKSEIHSRAIRWLDELGLEACRNRVVNELSGGQCQRVAIARAFALTASVIVMDEPTAELDATNRDLVLTLIANERERGAAFVVVSHDLKVFEHATSIEKLSPN